MNDIGKNLLDRKLIFQMTSDVILDKLNKESITFYIGFDMTAPSLHLGHILPLKTVNRLIKNGHKAIIILGGFTTQIGDPHGKNEARKILDTETILNNKKYISEQIHRLMDNEESVTIIDNNEWLGSLSYNDFLKEYARYVSVNQMTKLESAAERLNKQIHLSLLEFNYMVLQGIDFFHLYKHHDCILQLSGSDQWGNMLMGVDLVHKKLKETVFGLTLPLLTTSNGKKMGKTEDGAIWLDKNMCSPYDMWQYLRNVDDNDVLDLLNKLSDISIEEINNLFIKKDINDLKIILADELVQWIHGSDNLSQIKEEINRQFNKHTNKIYTLEEIKNSPSAQGFDESIINNLELEDLMVLTGLVISKSEARRKIGENSVFINNELIKEYKIKITTEMFVNGVLCLEFGKKHRRYLFLND
jgi:tyrosyl-tRNA synthetase